MGGHREDSRPWLHCMATKDCPYVSQNWSMPRMFAKTDNRLLSGDWDARRQPPVFVGKESRHRRYLACSQEVPSDHGESVDLLWGMMWGVLAASAPVAQLSHIAKLPGSSSVGAILRRPKGNSRYLLQGAPMYFHMGDSPHPCSEAGWKSEEIAFVSCQSMVRGLTSASNIWGNSAAVAKSNLKPLQKPSASYSRNTSTTQVPKVLRNKSGRPDATVKPLAQDQDTMAKRPGPIASSHEAHRHRAVPSAEAKLAQRGPTGRASASCREGEKPGPNPAGVGIVQDTVDINFGTAIKNHASPLESSKSPGDWCRAPRSIDTWPELQGSGQKLAEDFMALCEEAMPSMLQHVEKDKIKEAQTMLLRRLAAEQPGLNYDELLRRYITEPLRKDLQEHDLANMLMIVHRST
mmetsp:Transcript_11281/g.31985  ORF Transcript_11281/g.31985 Transcript_11281/m.31985 type:complete len:406 (-) Transcript_11281:444-1661(-)